MEDHDEVCLCFHVSLQKVKKFIRLTHPKVASRISECYGAGTGCGWCIPFLEKTFSRSKRGYIGYKDVPRGIPFQATSLPERGERETPVPGRNLTHARGSEAERLRIGGGREFPRCCIRKEQKNMPSGIFLLGKNGDLTEMNEEEYVFS